MTAWTLWKKGRSCKITNVGCIYKKPNVNSFQDFSNLLSDLQASMLSWLRFHSRVNSSLANKRRAWMTKIYSFTKFPTILQQDGHQYREKSKTNEKTKPHFTPLHHPPPDSSTYFPIKIFRSGPFPRKSSGACLFLVGLLGLSSTVLLKRQTSGTTCYFGMLSSIPCCCKNWLNPKSNKMIIWNGYFKTLHCCTSLSQSSDILRFSRHSSSPLC